MTDLINAIKDAPIPTILVVGGLVFIFLALAGRFSDRIQIPAPRQKLTGLLGAIILVAGIILFVWFPSNPPSPLSPSTPAPIPTMTALAPVTQVSIPTPTSQPTITPDSTAAQEPTATPTPVPTATSTPVPEAGVPALTNIILMPVADAYVRSGEHTDKNFGGALELDVKNDSEPSYVRYAFLKFDMSHIQGEVEGARVLLCPRRVGGATNLINEAVLVPHNTWEEDAINWNVRPSFSDTVLSSWMPTKGKYVEIDATLAAREAMLEDKKLSIGLRAVGIAEPEDAGDVRYHSREAHIDVKPRLELTDSCTKN